MRLLLDECVDEELRHEFVGHDCRSCRYAGLRGLKNGELLAAAEAAGFQALITVDRRMPMQQSMRGRSIALVIIAVGTVELERLLPLIPRVLEVPGKLRPGDVAVIE